MKLGTFTLISAIVLLLFFATTISSTVQNGGKLSGNSHFNRLHLISNFLQYAVKKQFLMSGKSHKEQAKALFWVSPEVNYETFLYALPFLVIPLSLVWVYWLYPPGKFYSHLPANYTDFNTMNATIHGVFN